MCPSPASGATGHTDVGLDPCRVGQLLGRRARQVNECVTTLGDILQGVGELDGFDPGDP